jgi:phage tail protein X
LIAVALLGLLGGIVGEQLGLWSLRTIVNRAVEMVRQRVALPFGIAVAPSTSGTEGARAGMAVTSSPQERPHKGDGNKPLVSPGALSGMPPVTAPPLLSAQSSTAMSVQSTGGEKEFIVKKVVVIRSGDTLSKILAQEYGEYTKAVVDLVSDANPGLRNIHFLEVGQRLILPERPE